LKNALSSTFYFYTRTRTVWLLYDECFFVQLKKSNCLLSQLPKNKTLAYCDPKAYEQCVIFEHLTWTIWTVHDSCLIKIIEDFAAPTASAKFFEKTAKGSDCRLVKIAHTQSGHTNALAMAQALLSVVLCAAGLNDSSPCVRLNITLAVCPAPVYIIPSWVLILANPQQGISDFETLAAKAARGDALINKYRGNVFDQVFCFFFLSVLMAQFFL